MEIDFPKKIDGYELKNKLGDGSMGIVFLAERLGQNYAFKIFIGSNAKKMMEKEYEISNIVAPLKPPFNKFSPERCPETIVCSLDKGDFLHNEKIYYYLVMEYIEGRELNELVRLHANLGTVNIIRFIYFICKGIDHMHTHGVAHRDIKLENIMYNNNQLKIIDLGFGCDINILIEPEDLSCFDGKIYGTPSYISPQYFSLHNSARVNPDNYTYAEMREIIMKNDIWALGILFAELCNYENVGDIATGKEVRYGYDIYKYLSGISKTKPKAPHVSIIQPDVDPSIQMIIEKCLILDYTQRPTAREIMDSIKNKPRFKNLF